MIADVHGWSVPASAQRIVVKVGTNVVMRDDGQPATARLYGLVESIAALRLAGREIILVSSGAIGLGVQRLALPERPQTLALKQACAAVGQGRLMALYADAFDRLGVVSAQVLLTEDDFAVPERSHNLYTTLDTLLEIGVVPIVNENDTISTLELERLTSSTSRQPIFSDNDHLSSLIATAVRASVLVLLSDVDGVYTANPAEDATATLIPVIHTVTDAMLTSACGGNARGRGGMASKLTAARLAAISGTSTIIANGRTPGILDRVCAGVESGTLVFPGERV